MKSNNGNNSRNSASSSQDTPKFRHGLFYNLNIRVKNQTYRGPYTEVSNKQAVWNKRAGY